MITFKGSEIEAIIFDMDGVLVNSEPHHCEIERRLFRKFDLKISEEEHSTYMGKASIMMWTEIAERYTLPHDPREIVKKNDAEAISYFKSLQDILPMPGLEVILNQMQNQNMPMAVASSAPPEVIQVILEKTRLQRFFRHVVNGNMVARSKPDPDIFLHAASLLQVSPEKCLVIEDSTNGIQAAKAARMLCVAYNGPGAKSQDQELADLIIDNYMELALMLQ